MQKASQFIYVKAAFPKKDIKENFSKVEINEQQRASLNRFNTEDNITTPTTKEEYVAALKQIENQTDKYNDYIDKIKIQINNIKNNNTDFSKKESSLLNKSSAKSSKFNLQGLLTIATIGLIFGAWITKMTSSQ